MLGAAEFAAVTVWPVAARQQRRVATLASRVPVPGPLLMEHYSRQMRTGVVFGIIGR
jgi:uncharacterized membrane protein